MRPAAGLRRRHLGHQRDRVRALVLGVRPGRPGARAHGHEPVPGLPVPADDRRPSWTPRTGNRGSWTTCTSRSPTPPRSARPTCMPLARWAKLTMLVQSAVSLVARRPGHRPRGEHPPDPASDRSQSGYQRGIMPLLLTSSSLIGSTASTAAGGRPWATTRATCATSSSTCSRCSAARTSWARARIAEVDEETARGMLAEVNRLATGPLAESFADADRNPPVFDPATGSVTMPEAFKKSFRAFMDAEWCRLDLPPELGGTARAPLAVLGGRRADPRRQPGGLDVLQRPGVRPVAVAARHPGAEARSPSWRSSAGGAPPWC